MASKRKPTKKVEAWEGITIGLTGALFLSIMLATTVPHGMVHDFLGIYTGAVLGRTDPAHLYDLSAQPSGSNNRVINAGRGKGHTLTI